MSYAALYWLKVWSIWAVLMSQPVCYHEVPDPERMAVIAQSIAAVSETRDDILGLLTIGHFESHWCKSVHVGLRKGGDGQGLWQIEPGSHRPGPYVGLGLAETTHAASQALWLWRHSRQCGNGLDARFVAYAGLGCAHVSPSGVGLWVGSWDRTDYYQGLRNYF